MSNLQNIMRRMAQRVSELGVKEQNKFWRMLQDFTGVVDFRKTIMRWLDGTLPSGTNLIKLRCFLIALGYEVEEPPRFQTEHRQLSELIGFGAMQVNELTTALGYAGPDSLLRVIREGSDISEVRQAKIDELYKQSEWLLMANKKGVCVYRRQINPTADSGNGFVEENELETAMILHTAHAVVGLIPLLEAISKLPPEHRQKFREKCSGKSLQRAIDGLVALTIEESSLPGFARNQ